MAILALAAAGYFDEHPSVREAESIAALAALLGDATRVSLLLALMDGRALTATELAAAGGVSASTASSHLARLTAAGWLAVLKQGRHRHYRIADAAHAELIERLQAAHALAAAPAVRTGPDDPALRHARRCYDHLAGTRGVQLLDALCARGLVDRHDEALRLTADGEAWCTALGVDLPALRASRRPLCRACLDWSERRMHLAGALGAALLERFVALGYLRRELRGRTLAVTPLGARFWDDLGRPETARASIPIPGGRD